MAAQAEIVRMTALLAEAVPAVLASRWHAAALQLLLAAAAVQQQHCASWQATKELADR